MTPRRPAPWGRAVSRRTFLIASLGGGAAVGAAVGISSVVGGESDALPPRSRPLFVGPFPRTFVFRQSEVLAQLRNYHDWAAAFVPFAGIMGKVLPEERTDTISARNLTYFNRFKRENGDKVVLLHYDGVARLPRYRTASWSAGDWLYHAGVRVTHAVTAADTTATVSDARQFRAPTNAFGSVGADLVLTGRTRAGRPDWTMAEHLVVTAVDRAARTLTVRRGAYGSTPLDLPAGAYLARHVTLGPVSARDDRSWAYNLATDAPRGPDGLSAAQRIAAEMQADFATDGQLHLFDGIELDAFFLPVPATDRATLDGNGDGVADGCYLNGADTFLAGQVELTDRLRAALGSLRLLSTDGARQQRPDAATVSGIEEEGFPRIEDPQLAYWSTSLGALEFWMSVGQAPHLAYPLAKTSHAIGAPADFPRFRISLAAALLTGCVNSFWDEPGGSSLDGLRVVSDSVHFDNRFTVWDELVDGAAGNPGWLGMPTGAAVRVATRSPDLLAGAGVQMPKSWTDQLRLFGATAKTLTPAALELEPTGTAEFAVRYFLHGFGGGDIVVACDLRTAATAGLPTTVPRQVTIVVVSGSTHGKSTHYVNTGYHSALSYARDLPAGTVSVTITFPGGPSGRVRNVRAYAAPDSAYRLFDNGAVFANPSSHKVDFDVSRLGSFVRLTATASQDASTNNGTRVAGTLTVPARDAIVVRRA